MSRPVPLAQLLCAAGLVMSLAAAPAFAQTPGLTLAGAIERALAANRTIAAARLQRPVDVAGIGVAAERPNPEFAFEDARDTPKYSLGGTLPIELGGKRRARLDVANATVAATDAELARVIAGVRNDVRRTYFSVVAADERAAFADEVRTLATRARDAARSRVDAGEVPQADLTQASLALALSEMEVSAARGDAESSRAELNALLGQPIGTPIRLADDLASGALVSLQDAIAQASQTNTEIIALDRQIDTQQAKVRLATALRTPDLSAGGAVTLDSQPDFQYGWRLTGTITVPIFTTHRAGVLVEESELARLKAEREALVARMSGAIASAVAKATAAREQVAQYQTEVQPLALEAERQAQVSYSAGQTGLVALVEALRTARETRQRGLQAAQDFQTALTDLEKAVGAPIR